MKNPIIHFGKLKTFLVKPTIETEIIKCLAKASNLAKDIEKIEKQTASFTEDPDETFKYFKNFTRSLANQNRNQPKHF